MIRTITLLSLFFLKGTSLVIADTYPQVLFENSILGGNYAYSRVDYSADSWVENVGGKLPVSDSVFFTPGNALSLRYNSAINGAWRAQIHYAPGSRGYQPRAGYVLTFKIFVVSNTSITSLPRMALTQKGQASNVMDLSKYIRDFQPNMWLNVQVPLNDIAGVDPGMPIDGIQFLQGEADNKTHWLYIDQIEFLPANPPRVKLSSPAVLSTAVAYDRHVDLTWQLPLTPSIRYIKIYRSEDNEHFHPVAIRPIFVQKCTDFVPYSDRTYYYKIAWVDYGYLESPFSNVLEASPKTASDEAMVDFIQAAHLNYFIERTEINSGMHAIHFGVDDATVSVKETGLSILAYLVGVERGLLPRTAAIGRLQRIVDFLGKVDRYHGAFPEKIDGRTGEGIFTVDTVPEGNLTSTAFLMQGLLAAQQYFEADSGEADVLTAKIDTLWNSVEWDRFTIEGQEHILLDRWSPTVGFRDASPLGGFGDDFICYVLALASPQHALPGNAYTAGLGFRRELADSSHVMELANNTSFAVKVEATNVSAVPAYVEYPYAKDTTLYSLPVTVGAIDTSLMEAYKPFLAFDPRAKRDTFADYFANHRNLTQAYKRRDTEKGYGGFSRDIWGAELSVDSLDTLCTINPAIPCASYAYLPQEAVQSMRAFYDKFGQALFTEYGFRRGIGIDNNAVADTYDAANQAAVVVMIENGRSGLIWDLFSRNPGIQKVVENYFNIE
ncbi:glucoamylase family protein [Parapedobacter sp. GCM10030251]|uniref:glucoamylase family protein n=1 Tax=Parapedobacter sp. GCM10030251 TaxID=3273419 RepID=UPI00361358B4